MKTDKEYPATHSMDTAWYCVDEENNVAMFSIGANGPVPQEADDSEFSLMDLCYYEPVTEINGRKYLNFTDDQVLTMFEGLWETELPDEYVYWSEIVIQIDPLKKDIMFNYIDNLIKKMQKWEHYEALNPICLSERLGVYMIDFCSHDFGKGRNNIIAQFLYENKIIQRYCEIPYLDYYEFDEDMSEFDSKCPYYIYTNDYYYDPEIPHIRKSVPLKPMKLKQLPRELREKAIRLPLLFSESPKIQLACHDYCYLTAFAELYTEDGFCYVKVKLPDGKCQYVINNTMLSAKTKELKIENNEKRIHELIRKQPYTISQEEADRLKKLPINKDYKEYD